MIFGISSDFYFLMNECRYLCCLLKECLLPLLFAFKSFIVYHLYFLVWFRRFTASCFDIWGCLLQNFKLEILMSDRYLGNQFMRNLAF